MTFKEYIRQLFDGVPADVYLLLLAIFCLGTLLLIACRGVQRGGRSVLVLLLAEYVFLLFGSTVLFRAIDPEIGHDITPFWSYVEIYHGDEQGLLQQNMMNVIVFIPLGLLLGTAFRSMTWWKAGLTGCCLSVTIETMQYVFRRGFSEFDDVFHNVIGCMIGYAIAAVIVNRQRVKKTF